MSDRAHPTLAALLAAPLALACAAGDGAMRRDVDALREQVSTLQRENDRLSRKVESLDARVDLLSARAAPARPAAASTTPAASAVVPPDLAVVKMEPPRRAARAAPPLRTDVPLREPEPGLVESLAREEEDLAARAAAELAAAREAEGVARARALEEFVRRFPRHPAADNALVEAGRARDAAGDRDDACVLVARAAREYPAGDAVPDALADLAECHARAGDDARARELSLRLLSDYPDSAAARRHPPRQGATP